MLDDERMQLLAKEVFQEQFKHLMLIIEQLGEAQQVHFSALSVIALDTFKRLNKKI